MTEQKHPPLQLVVNNNDHDTYRDHPDEVFTSMIIEGRTITTLAELKEFADAAIALAKLDPSSVRLQHPVALRLHEHAFDSSRKEYVVEVRH